jgi:enoyl-CoA hydratase
VSDSPSATRYLRVEALVEGHDGVALVSIDRPEVRNALNFALLADLADVLEALDADEDVRAVVLTGTGEAAFAAGADITELAEQTPERLTAEGHFDAWERIAAVGVPVIAAVRGYALGGGCELALMCDFILAADTAKFGQPEINLGVIPGAGGTQRLPRFIGKAKAMEMILLGQARMMDAQEAERCGMVSRIVPAAELVEEALRTAQKIAELSLPIVMMAKESVNRAFETTLNEGVRFERRLFHSTFATEDQKEGMAAFAEKRKPQFKNR